MLDHILRQVQAFEREHGREPNTLFLNPDHLAAIEACCPGLFSDTPPITLGLSVQVWPKSSLLHPRVAYLAQPAHMLGHPQATGYDSMRIQEALLTLIAMHQGIGRRVRKRIRH